MIHWKTISDADARSAIEQRDFPLAVCASCARVAIVLTQGWCHQWSDLKRGLERIASSEEREIDVHVFVYDRSPLFDEFLKFKERVLGNDIIPYVRYYRDGRFLAATNYLPVEEFLDRFS